MPANDHQTTTSTKPTAPAGEAAEKPAAETTSKPDPSPGQQLVLGLVFGIIFGFLLQKGGVGKYHVLVGVLLLEDFTVIKVMLSAIVVGMVGVYSLSALGMVNLHIKPTRYAANIFGGLLFGVGFALLGYCPGTNAAALGQGNFDALAGILGLMAGSYLFAETSGALDRTVLKWGDRGKLTLPELLHLPLVPVLVVLVPVLCGILFAVDQYAAR